MGLFERCLTVWVGLCIVAGVILGNQAAGVFQAIAALEYAHVNLVVEVFIWVMIYPMMVQIDFAAIRQVGDKPRGLVTCCAQASSGTVFRGQRRNAGLINSSRAHR
jgi:ACR3 family arsenite transporter